MKFISSALFFLGFGVLFTACSKNDFPGPHAKKYSNDVAVEWIQLQQQLIKTTPGFGSGPAGRSFAYSGLTMYESIVPGMHGYQSLFSQIAGISLSPSNKFTREYYWPASVNGAMAQIIRSFFANTSEANKAAIDALEAAFTAKFQDKASADELQRSADFGKQVANSIFEWSKTDGTLSVNPPYVAPVGPGLWVPTPPAFSPPNNPYGGNNRPIVPNLLNYTMPPPPIAYSEDPSSDFYKMVNQVYNISQTLTADEINIATTWSDIPANYSSAAHFTNIVTQLVVLNKLPLNETALLYAKHGIAINDAAIPIFKSKYQYNLVRPITYVRTVLAKDGWNTVVPTPSNPEYLSGHAVGSQASAEVLKEKFGNRYHFVDRTHDNLYGSRSYSSFDDYAYEAGWSTVLAGVHYGPTIEVSLVIGKKVGQLVNTLKFKK